MSVRIRLHAPMLFALRVNARKRCRLASFRNGLGTRSTFCGLTHAVECQGAILLLIIICCLYGLCCTGLTAGAIK